MGGNGKVTGFILLGSKITTDGDCSHEIKRSLFLGRKVMINIANWKAEKITLMTKVHILTAMVFPVVVYECENWTIKKAEPQGTDAFKLWCCWRLLRTPWTARRSNQSILEEINPEYSLEGLMLELQYFVHPPGAKSWLIGRDPDVGKDWGQEDKGMIGDETVGWYHWLSGHEFGQNLGDSGEQGSLVCYSPWDCKELGMT